jgi:hypothetical protein
MLELHGMVWSHCCHLPDYLAPRYVEELISGEVASGVPASRIVVGGFSQGGAVALMMLRSNTKLAGIIGGWRGGCRREGGMYPGGGDAARPTYALNSVVCCQNISCCAKTLS